MAEKNEKKPGFFKRIGSAIAKFWRDFASECKKISWMGGNDVLKNTVLVVICAVAVGAVIGLLDYGFSQAIHALGSLVG